MRIIALTGGIATGKSTVAQMLSGHGAAVVDADRIAREVVEPGTPGLEAVVAVFGRQLLTAGGGLDRGALAEIVFADVESRRRLEAITHPLILARMAGEVAALAGSDAPLVVVDTRCSSSVVTRPSSRTACCWSMPTPPPSSGGSASAAG